MVKFEAGVMECWSIGMPSLHNSNTLALDSEYLVTRGKSSLHGTCGRFAFFPVAFISMLRFSASALMISF